MLIQYRVRPVLIYMCVALFKMRLLRNSLSNIRGPVAVNSQNSGPSTYAPGLYVLRTKLAKDQV